MHNGWRLGRLFRIPISIHYSWLFMFALLVWSLVADYLPMHHPGITGGANWAWAIAAALLFFASVLAHELAHSLIARSSGIPVEGITLFALGGVSELKQEATRPRVELAVALVGPLTSLALAAFFWLAWQAILPWSMPAAAVAFYLAYGNAVIGVFNLIPAFPLDGGRVLRAAVWATTGDLDRATRLAVRAGRLAAGLLVAFGAWQAFGGSGANGLWLILIGWFLWSAAEQEKTRTTLRSALRGRTVETFVRRQVVVLDANRSVADAVERIAASPPQPLYPVVGSDSPLGAITPHDIAKLPAERRQATSLNWLTRQAPSLPTLSLGIDAITALVKLDEFQTEALPVADGAGQVVGTFERGAVLRWVQLRSSLTPHHGAAQ